jgi:hypothetical protein
VAIGIKSNTFIRPDVWPVVDKFGPDKLAKFLGLPLEDVFPIAYDISHAAQGKHDVLIGTISV